MYLVYRAKLYCELDKLELAVKDIVLANQLQPEEGTLGLYPQNTMRNILKLSSVQKTIIEMKDKGEITFDEAKILMEYVEDKVGLFAEEKIDPPAYNDPPAYSEEEVLVVGVNNLSE